MVKKVLIDRVKNFIKRSLLTVISGICIHICEYGSDSKHLRLKIHSGTQTKYLTVLIEVNHEKITDVLKNGFNSTLFTEPEGYYEFNFISLLINREKEYINWILTLDYNYISLDKYISYFYIIPKEISVQIFAYLDKSTLDDILTIFEKGFDFSKPEIWKLMLRCHNHNLYDHLIEIIAKFYKKDFTVLEWKSLYKYLKFRDIPDPHDKLKLVKYMVPSFWSHLDNMDVDDRNIFVVLTLAQFKLYGKYLNNFYDKLFGSIDPGSINVDDISSLVDSFVSNEKELLYVIENYPNIDLLYFSDKCMYTSFIVNNCMIPFIFRDDIIEAMFKKVDNIYTLRYFKFITELFSACNIRIEMKFFKYCTDDFFVKYKSYIDDNLTLREYLSEYFIKVIYPSVIIEMYKRNLIK